MLHANEIDADACAEIIYKAIEALNAYELDAQDAARYCHIKVHGWPVRNQTGDPDRKWIAFADGKEFFGATPSFAIDAARGGKT